MTDKIDIADLIVNEEIEKKIADNSLEVNDMNWNLAMLGGGLGGEIL